jgi:hypothetical protein
MIADSGAGLYACRASVDMFGLTIEDFVPQGRDIISVGEFYNLAAVDHLHVKGRGRTRLRRRWLYDRRSCGPGRRLRELAAPAG